MLDEGTPRGTETGRTCSNPHGADRPPYEITGFRPSFLRRKVASFDESRCLKTALDLAEGLRLKPPRPQARWCELLGDALPAAVRSAVPALPSGWREPLPRSRLEWRRRVPSTGRRTTSLHARLSPRMVAS